MRREAPDADAALSLRLKQFDVVVGVSWRMADLGMPRRAALTTAVGLAVYAPAPSSLSPYVGFGRGRITRPLAVRRQRRLLQLEPA